MTDEFEGTGKAANKETEAEEEVAAAKTTKAKEETAATKATEE